MEQNIIEKAIMFATLAHAGQVRKSTPDKPKIVHCLAVAQILLEYGADNNVISAAILHDVVEDTKYSLEDIKDKFNDDIAHLVEVASEPDKGKTWEERKSQTIESTKSLSMREKLVPMADKINNVEDMKRTNIRSGKKDFSAFKRGEEYQEWYFRNMYESFLYGQDKENYLIKRFENAIDSTFERSMEEYNNSIDKINIERKINEKILEQER